MANLLDGTLLEYTYSEMGTVRASYDNGYISFEWLAGPMSGQTGEGFPYRARKVGADQFFVNWHEPELPGFVTLYVDFEAGRVHSSLIAGYGSEDEQIHFDTASIDRVERR